MKFMTLPPPQGLLSLPSYKILLNASGNEKRLFCNHGCSDIFFWVEAIPDQKKTFCQESKFSVGRLIFHGISFQGNEMKCSLWWQTLSLHLSRWLVGFPGSLCSWLEGCIRCAWWVVFWSEQRWAIMEAADGSRWEGSCGLGWKGAGSPGQNAMSHLGIREVSVWHFWIDVFSELLPREGFWILPFRLVLV